MLSPRRTEVRGGGAAVAAAPTGRLPRTYTLDELGTRADALALRVGTRATASVLLLACVVVILIGAQSLLNTMQAMDHDIKEMNEQLAIANAGTKILNDTMDALPLTAEHITEIVGTVEGTSAEVTKSAAAIDSMATTTGELDTQLASIATSTGEMSDSLASASEGTTTLSTTIDSLNTNITPLVKTQHQMLLGTKKMRTGLDGMNASLAYTIRIMNYNTAPPTGGGMTIRANLPKQTLPPIPGIKAEVEPVPVFARNIWPIYTGP